MTHQFPQVTASPEEQGDGLPKRVPGSDVWPRGTIRSWPHTDKGAQMPHRKTLPPVTPDYMRVAEVAARLGVDRKTVRNRLISGSMPVRVLRFDGLLRLHRQDFEEYLERASKLLSNSA